MRFWAATSGLRGSQSWTGGREGLRALCRDADTGLDRLCPAPRRAAGAPSLACEWGIWVTIPPGAPNTAAPRSSWAARMSATCRPQSAGTVVQCSQAQGTFLFWIFFFFLDVVSL